MVVKTNFVNHFCITNQSTIQIFSLILDLNDVGDYMEVFFRFKLGGSIKIFNAGFLTVIYWIWLDFILSIMGTIFVDNLEPQSGTSLTLGASGDTVSS